MIKTLVFLQTRVCSTPGAFGEGEKLQNIKNKEQAELSV